MSKAIATAKQIVGYDAVKSAKDNMKEAKFDNKKLITALLGMFVGFILFVRISPEHIAALIFTKILGLYLLLNGIGLLLGSFHFDDMLYKKAEKATDNTFFHKKKDKKQKNRKRK